ncbi:MAG: HDOD domain-containing protein [Planctomycetota bacterium]|jgi:HD-like signal output (HDOD) protein|nr:HDOD domain-containing protein [Planctomycetota bacterium]
MVSDPDETLIQNIVDLPTLPQIINTLMTMLDDPDSSVRDITNVMGKDQTLVAKILKLVNSAFYAIPKRVSSVSQAIAILGFKTIKSLVLSSSIIGMFEGNDENFDYQEFWINSIGVGTISRFLILKLAGDPYSGCAAIHPDTGFVTGLLAGIGKVVMEQYCHDAFVQIIEKAKTEQIAFREAEMALVDTNYASIGYLLAKRWNLPDEVQVPIRFQDSIEECPRAFQSLAAVIALAKYLCRLKQYGQCGDFDNPPKPPKQAAVVLTLSKESLPLLTKGLAEEFEKTEAFLAVIRS